MDPGPLVVQPPVQADALEVGAKGQVVTQADEGDVVVGEVAAADDMVAVGVGGVVHVL